MKKKILLIILAAWILIPTGTPDDILTVWIIGILGFNLYVLAIMVVFILIIKNKITIDKIKKTMKGLIK
tara:strand:- start:791 stop:997 length:207 start_codon:yes stop_codon:yes gene_type:complete